jgi:hypothetical protein
MLRILWIESSEPMKDKDLRLRLFEIGVLGRLNIEVTALGRVT